MKRIAIKISEVAEFNNMAFATFLAAKGKRNRTAVRHFFDGFEQNIYNLGNDINKGLAPYGRYEQFLIRDPKHRVIHAACFEDRVVHHAIIRHVGPVLEKALVHSTFACRVGKGNLAAIYRVQKGVRRYPWFVKLDILRFFASIDHEILLNQLKRKIKGSCCDLVGLIIDSFSEHPGKGLPIGSLTSQHFANFYMSSFDRFLMEKLRVKCHVRYMDDVIWWCRSREEAKLTLLAAREFLQDFLVLQCNEKAVQINRSSHGVTYCGYRVLPGSVRLTPRKRCRYSQLRRINEIAFQRGEISGIELQQLYASLSAVMNQAASLGWRSKEHLCNGVVDA
ncbi:RNA-directed DNA polymerase [Maridesulfovibrio frigidus]|uniref:RNA-directed DNA polymerase n=1 Tax=Maridesulfovibrio frigidus TaxID=340956 RepID=UPI00068F5248|nr:RNA-directed DNA polymerase [Maridesulfovibrio frigidus]